MSRLISAPGPYTAFLAGILVFPPGDFSQTAAGLVLIVVINVWLVWLALLAYLAAPGPTTRLLTAFTGWLRRHGHAILSSALVAAGAILAVNGIAGLIQKG